jgi:hypothetical protein
MTWRKREIMEMAREAGIGWAESLGGMPEFLEDFWALVREEQQTEVQRLIALVRAQQITIDKLEAALAQPEQKPMHPELRKMLEDYFDKCFAESAPQRTWVGLTDEERRECLGDYITLEGRARAIEAKLKEKNT